MLGRSFGGRKPGSRPAFGKLTVADSAPGSWREVGRIARQLTRVRGEMEPLVRRSKVKVKVGARLNRFRFSLGRKVPYLCAVLGDGEPRSPLLSALGGIVEQRAERV